MVARRPKLDIGEATAGRSGNYRCPRASGARSCRRRRFVVKEYEFWRESATGHVFAIALVDGVVAGVCGPLGAEELDERFLPTFDYAAERAATVEERREEFELHPTTVPF
jgi:hypothetical protein